MMPLLLLQLPQLLPQPPSRLGDTKMSAPLADAAAAADDAVVEVGGYVPQQLRVVKKDPLPMMMVRIVVAPRWKLGG